MPKQSRAKKQSSINTVKKSLSLKRRLLRFLPAILIFGAAALINLTAFTGTSQPTSVLSYATSVNISDLLSETNIRRSSDGIATLGLNDRLNSAAQAKADDMVARDYWSHNTPDGEEPWAFMTRAGYNYQAAGENLAYGFATSSDTVTGWMNSPPHRENLLKNTFMEVGFGIANSPDYVSTGEETIVVAMYGAQRSQAATPSTVVSSPPKTQAATQTVPVPASVVEPIETMSVAQPEAVPVAEATESAQPIRLAEVATAAPMNVRRIQILTGGNAAWSATLLVSSLCGMGILWVLNRGLHFKRLALAGERFVLHHAHFDITVIAIFTLGWTLLSGGGVIR